MISNFKIRIKNYIDSHIDSIKLNQNILQQTNFSYNQLSNLFEESNFIPFSAWAISPNTILHVLNDIILNKRKNILEFGAGASTFYMAKLIETHALKTVFYSVESNKDWADEMERQLQILNIDDKVKIIYAPIVKVKKDLAFNDQSTWYDTELLNLEIHKDIKFDLILVDGPAGATSSFARYSAVPYLKNNLANNFSVFLDDIDREDEKKIVLEWQKILDCQALYRDRYAYFMKESNFDVSPFQIR